MEFTHSDARKILEIIDKAEHVEEFELTLGDVHMHLRRHSGESFAPSRSSEPPPTAQPTQTEPKPSAAAEVPAAKPASAAPKPATVEVPEGMVAIRAPVLGTFYRAPSPSEPPFVEIGQEVKQGDTVCLIEVMKLFNSISANVDGVIEQFLVENGSLVEFDQILFLVRPT